MALLSVGEVAAQLGVAPSTVRMWGTRYGLTASARSPGGHRRYTDDDMAALHAMHAAVIAGSDPAAAAAGQAAPARSGGGSGIGTSAPGRVKRRSGAGGAVLAVPGAGAAARGLARAASRLDEIGVEDSVVSALRELGTIRAWDDVVRPVLVAAGERWERTGSGIELEHLLTQAVTTAFVRYAATLRSPDGGRPVLLAGGPREEHVLPLHALRSALAERDVGACLLGPRTPMDALARAARRTRAPAVLVWLSRPDRGAGRALPQVTQAHRGIRVLLGGPGWSATDRTRTAWCAGLADAADALTAAAAT